MTLVTCTCIISARRSQEAQKTKFQILPIKVITSAMNDTSGIRVVGPRPSGIVNSLVAMVVSVLEVLRFLSQDATIASQQVLLAKISEDKRFHNRK